MVQRRVGYLRLRWYSTAWTVKRRPKPCGMDRQTLRDWVHRYNIAGLAGLRNLKSPGPGSKLTARQQAELAELVEAGPDPAVHGVVRWRRVDLRDELQRRFGVVLHERSVGKVLAKLGYRKLSVRPRHPQADEEAAPLQVVSSSAP
jgi:transposase